MNAQQAVQTVQGDQPIQQADPHGVNTPEHDADILDFEALKHAFLLNRRLVALILVLGLALGIASIVMMPRIYTARASVQIDQQTRKVLATEDNDPAASAADADRFLQTQVDVLGSRSMAKRVSDVLGLAASDNFMQRTTGHAPGNLAVGEREDLVIDTLQKSLQVDLPHNSRVVGVMFKSRDPVLAAQIANTFVAEFIKGNIQRKFSASSYSLDFLNTQLGMAKSRLEDSERTLITYSRTAGLIDASAGAVPVGQPQGPQSLVTANLVELNQRSGVAKAERLQAEERWRQASSTPLMQLPEVLSNSAVQQLLQNRAQLSSSWKSCAPISSPSTPRWFRPTPSWRNWTRKRASWPNRSVARSRTSIWSRCVRTMRFRPRCAG